MARVICLRLFVLLMRLAAARTFCTAGRSSPISTPMMAITTSNSISVNARRVGEVGRVEHVVIFGPPNKKSDKATHGSMGNGIGRVAAPLMEPRLKRHRRGESG